MSTSPMLRGLALFALLMLTLSIAGPAQADNLILAGPNTRTAIIIDDDWKPHRWSDWGGHKIFQRFAQAITDQNIPIVKASKLNPDDYDVRIWVGRQPHIDAAIGAQLDALDDDGYMIHVNGNDVYMAGKFWWADNWVAHDVLERWASCRWYLYEPRFWMPKEDGIVGPGDIIPKAATITIPADAHIVEEPDYKARWFRITPIHSFRLRQRDHFHHAFVNIIPPDTFDQHPDWFPLIDGKRHKPTRRIDFQPCASNPAVVAHVADAAIAYFQAKPEEGTFSIGMNDSGHFCQCDACLAIAPSSITDPNQRIAYSFFDFYNRIAARVAEQYPRKRLGCLAYARLRSLPAGSIKLHPMIVPYLTLDSAQLHEESQRIEFRDSAEKWRDLTTRMGIYEYIYGGGFLIPRIFNRYLFANIKNHYNINIDGFYAEAYPNWGLDGPKYWVAAKLLWDTSLDPDTLLNQFYTDMFGSSANAMRAYFDHLEEVWCSQTLESDRSNYRWLRDPKQLQIFSPQDCAKAWSLINAAHQQAPNDAVRKRIDFFRTSFNVSRILCTRAAHAATAEALFDRETPDIPAAFGAIEQWLNAGDLDAAVAAARELGFSAFSTTSGDELNNVNTYDNQPNKSVERIMMHAASAAAAAQPATMAAAREAIAAEVTSLAKGENAPAATAWLTQLTQQRGLLFINTLSKAPTIDGSIESAAWGDPDFDGHFHNFAHAKGQSNSLLQTLAPDRTRVWASRHEDTLYLAFDCEQDPQTIGATVTENDTTFWRSPDMINDDCIALTFKANGRAFQCLRINANGATSDYQGGKQDWNVITASAVSRTERGWQVELAINLAPLNITPKVDVTNMPTMSVARYTRQVDPKGKAPTRAEATTLLPFAAGRGVVGHGNAPNLMVFASGSLIIYEPSN